MNSLFSRFISLLSTDTEMILARIFSWVHYFPGSFHFFQPVRRRFLPGFSHEFIIFPVHFTSFSRYGDDSCQDFLMNSLFSRFISLLSTDTETILARIFSWIHYFPGLFHFFQPVRRRFLPGFSHEFIIFPVYFTSFSRYGDDSCQDFSTNSSFSRFISLLSTGTETILARCV